jgi:hypothetical protein
MLATEYARYYEIEAQRDGESDEDFRLRVSNALRAMGKIIEAKEAYLNRRYEDSESVLDSVAGEIGRAMGVIPQYSRPRTHQDEGDKLAAGAILRRGKDDPDPMALLFAALMR